MPARPKQRTRKPAPRNGTIPPRPKPNGAGAAAAPLPVDADTAARRLARVRDALAALSAGDLDLLLGQIPLDERGRIARALGVTVDPRYAPGGLGRLLARRLLHVPPAEQANYALGITQRLSTATAEFLGDRLEEPSAGDIAALADALLQDHPAPAVRLFFAAVSERSCPASPHLDTVLETDERLTLPAVDQERDGGDLEALPAADVAANGAGGPEADGPGAAGVIPIDARAFSPLDDLILRTIVRTHTGTTGAPAPDALRLVVDELLHLSTERAASYHHLGFLTAFDPATSRPNPPAMDPERWRWYRFGRLCGFAAQGNHTGLLAAAEEREAEAVAIVADPRMGPRLADDLLVAILPSRPDLAARLLEAAPPGSVPSVLVAVRERARSLLAERRPAEAEALLIALLPHLGGSAEPASGTPTPTAADTSERTEPAADHPALPNPELIRAACALAAARRAANDFPGAAAVLALLPAHADAGGLPAPVAARLAVERGLLAGGFGRLGHVHPARHDDERTALAGRLSAGRAHFEAALALRHDDPVAAYCLGMLALAERRPADAAELLGQADGRPARDEPELAALLPVARFHRGLAGLESLDPAVEGPSYQAVVDALDLGFNVTAAELAGAVCALQAQRSPRSGPFLLRAVRSATEPALLLAPAVELARAADPAAVDAAAILGADRRLTRTQRFEALAAALTGAGLLGRRDRLDVYCEALDDLVTKGCDPALDAAWEALLAENDHLRDALGSSEAEVERIAVLRRTGELGRARTIATRCFHRALAGEFDPYDAADLHALLAELDADPAELAALDRLLGTHTTPAMGRGPASGHPGAVPAKPIRLVFVGGHETQAQWHLWVDAEVDRRYAGQVRVDWFPGFAPDWKKILDQARSKLRAADALVLMPYVRTNLGRHLRAGAGEAGLPWIPCTAKGRDSLLGAVERAVGVVASLRPERSGSVAP